MAFIDNPVISALGKAIGLGPLFGEATPAIKPAASKPNIPNYRERPYIPRNMGGPSNAGGVQPGGSTPITPGAEDAGAYADPGVQRLMAQFGVHPSDQQPDPNLFIHNPEAFQKHPVAAGLLERGLEGLEFSHPGTNFLQSLVGGVRGMGEANAARAAQVNSQIDAPLVQAQRVAALQHLSDEHNTAVDNIDYHKGLLDVSRQNAQTKEDRLSMVPPRSAGPGRPQKVWDGNGWVDDPNFKPDPQASNKNAFFDGALSKLITAHGGNPDLVTPEERAGIEQQWQTILSRGRGASAEERTKQTERGKNSRKGGGGSNAPGKLDDVKKSQLKDLDHGDKTDEDAIKASSNRGFAIDENGKRLIVGSDGYRGWLSRTNSRKEARQRQRDSIRGGGAPAPAAPQYSADNPYK